MMMKALAIFSLILVFWCHQSHHQLFLLNPLGLASEEFIPAASEAIPPTNPTIPTPTPDPHQTPPPSRASLPPRPTRGTVRTPPPEETTVTPNTGGSHPPNPDSNSKKAECAEELFSAEAELDRIKLRDKGRESAEVPPPPPSPREAADNPQGSQEQEIKVEDSQQDVPPPQPPHQQNNNNEPNGGQSAEGQEVRGEGAEEVDLKNRTAEVTESTIPTDKPREEGTQVEPPAVARPAVPAQDAQANKKEDEPIPSFMEWTQQKLHESNLANGATGTGHQNGGNGHRREHSGSTQQNRSAGTPGTLPTTKTPRKEPIAKNFASPDCGAKVIQSNPESQNANGVLSSSHDEYMLNKCGIPIWFIVELCEPLKIEKVSIGNLELFSSSPKDVEIGISDRYPTRDWSKLGPFTLPDIRAIHSINLPATNASTFGKFLKVNILSHYGEEHFCPLSLVRVNGISEYEVLESENTHPEDIDAVDKEESALYEEPVIMDHDQAQQKSPEGQQTDKSVFGTVKDAVNNIVRKVAQVVAKSDNTKDSARSDGMPLSNCRSLLQCLPNYDTPLRHSVLSLLSCNFSNLLPFLSKNLPWCGWDYCHALFSKHSIGLPWQPEGFYASVFGGPPVLHALCNYHRPLMKDSCSAQFITNVSATSSTDVIPEEGIINETVRTPPVVLRQQDQKEQQPPESMVPPVNAHYQVDENPETVQQGQPDTIEQPVPTSGETVAPVETGEAQQPVAPPIPAQNVHPSGGNAEDAPAATTTPQGTQPPQQQQNAQQQQQQQQPPPPPQQQQHSGGGSGQQQQQKESVFVRLSNRIKTLERNQTLTASYLEELSRRFKKQNEENHNVNEGTKSYINESRVKFKVLEDLYRFELRSLRRNTDEIRERLFNVQLQRSVLILLCLLQFIGILSVCLWARRRFRQMELQFQRLVDPQSTPVVIVPPAVSTPPRAAISASGATRRRSDASPGGMLGGMRKRLSSDMSTTSSLNSFDKSKKIKKKKKKLPDLKPVNVNALGPASAPVDLEYPRKLSTESEFKFEYPSIPPSRSAYEVVYNNYKENINPQTPVKRERHLGEQPQHNSITPTPSTPPGGGGIPSLLSTSVDSPFQMISSATPNFFVDSGVSTSSRFALLASPGPGGGLSNKNTGGIRRSGSLTSLDSSSTSSYSGVKTGSHSVSNGHGDSQSQGSNGSGKKRKNKGLKALMPKIFDR